MMLKTSLKMLTSLSLLSSIIETEFKSKTHIDVVTTSGLSITYPDEIVLTPTENLVIKLSLSQSTRDFFRRYVYITYNGETIDFSLKEEDEITEESIEKVLKLADKFDKICKIIKEAYNL